MMEEDPSVALERANLQEVVLTLTEANADYWRVFIPVSTARTSFL